MAEVGYAAKAVDDLVRLEDASPGARSVISSAIMLLTAHPLIGRRAEHDLRELVISRGKTGYVALYDFDELPGRVVIHGVRHQREVGFEG